MLTTSPITYWPAAIVAGALCLVVVAVAGCGSGCPVVPYEPAGIEVASAAECSPGTCAVECTGTEVCEEQGMFCESCARFFAYAVENCHNCTLGEVGDVSHTERFLRLTCPDRSF